MFDLVHLTQEEGWRPKKATIAIQTNFFSSQREQEGIISPSKRITATVQAQHSDAKNLIGGIRNNKSH